LRLAETPSELVAFPARRISSTGAPLAELKTCAVERVAHGDPWDERQYEMKPVWPKN
jgi:hypothetical protein